MSSNKEAELIKKWKESLPDKGEKINSEGVEEAFLKGEVEEAEV